jgi:hypothetical protein
MWVSSLAYLNFLEIKKLSCCCCVSIFLFIYYIDVFICYKMFYSIIPSYCDFLYFFQMKTYTPLTFQVILTIFLI